MFISLIRKHLWMFVVFLILPSTNVFGIDAQTDASIQIDSQAAPTLSPKIISPHLESIERPADQYTLGDVIKYQIKVRWPERSLDVRINSPEVELENLALDGVAEETVSDHDQSDDVSVEQILTLRFKAEKAGPAKIKSLVLEWTQADGVLSSKLKIPPVDLMIQERKNPWIWISGSGLLLVGSLSIVFLIRRKNKKSEPIIPPQTVEEKYLNELQDIKNSIEKDSNDREILSHLDGVLDQYIRQKFNWNRKQGDYNALQKNLDKKETVQLKEFFDKMEYLRFSGSELDCQELMVLFEKVQTFIERKKMV